MSAPLIHRRTALRGAGALVALPVLEAMLPRRASAAEATPAPARLCYVYAPNGKHMADWTPASVGAVAAPPPTLAPLSAVWNRVAVLSGLSLRNADANGDGPGDHARAMSAFLTGVRPHKTAGADVRAGVSADQVAALAIGRTTRLPSLEVGCEGGKAGTCDNGYSCAYQTNLSWRAPGTPMPKEVDPRLVFERLFGDKLRPGAGAARARRDRDRRSVLDFVAEDTRHLLGTLGAADRRKLDEYLGAVREVERRIQVAQPAVAVGAETLVRPTGVPENYAEHAGLLVDLVALAFRADLTRVATIVLGNDGSNRPYREVNVSDGHHDVSHHGNDPAKQEKIRRVNRLHVAQYARLVAKLASVPDGAGTLLDRTSVVYGSGIHYGDRHDHDDLPVLVAGGGTAGGRHLRYAAGTPLCNLHLELLGRAGASVERFGDSTGRLAGLAG